MQLSLDIQIFCLNTNPLVSKLVSHLHTSAAKPQCSLLSIFKIPQDRFPYTCINRLE